MSIIEDAVSSPYHYIEFELNRLAGTLVGGQPTLGPATAALWWWGHRELNWAHANLLTPNQATAGASLETTEGFSPLYGETLEIIDAEGIIGSKVLKITAPSTLPSVEPLSPAALYLTDRIPVEPMHIYTLSAYVKALQETKRGTHPQFVWFDAEGLQIGPTDGGLWSSKPNEWTHIWVTAPAPENAVSVQFIIYWDTVMPSEAFCIDKLIFHNSSDVQAWAFPGHAAVDRALGLKAHLNMQAGIYNPDEFVSVGDAATLLSGVSADDPADSLSRIPTPNPLVVS